MARIEGRNRYMHQLILGILGGGTTSPGIDHRNGDGLDNRRTNLRIATHVQNAANSRPRKGRQFKGTVARGDRWCAFIQSDGRSRYLGTFSNEPDAARAYDAAALAAWGEYAWLNFPEENR